LRIQCQNSTSSGLAGRPQYQVCLGATRRHASETSKTRAANSNKTGANTAQHSEASAMALSQPVAHQVMWSTDQLFFAESADLDEVGIGVSELPLEVRFRDDGMTILEMVLNAGYRQVLAHGISSNDFSPM